MKLFFSFLFLAFSLHLSAQETKQTCNDLPLADPEVRASCLTEDILSPFKGALTEKLKKGTHTAVFKFFVTCNGEVTNVAYQRGTVDSSTQSIFAAEINKLKWKPATHKSKQVTSVVFLTIEIVNAQITISIR
ncbi:MAG: hypothetical protein JNJ99_12110 [Crocinitomicaceae bacterium]|nr:hypothetical protein [Crocinitomicaceae bacterium]